MSSNTGPLPELDSAHVLFTDMVGYSLLPLSEQHRLLVELENIVRSCEAYQRAERSKDVIIRSTGDGVALVFFHNLTAPVGCALEIARALKSRPGIRLRMGVHSGFVLRRTDFNAQQDVTGEGINIAQRVMDCGDDGHILLSSAVAERLREWEGWSDALRDLGECEVRHGVRLRIFNLVSDDLGNSAVPQKLRDAPEKSGLKRVTLLYKRNCKPDTELLAALEKGLADSGYRVFVDRHLTVGVEWSREILRQIETSDAVVPLLSEASLRSDIFALEISTAQAALRQNGKPRLLPVRVAYEGGLGEELGPILDPFQNALWQGPQDTERVLAELIYALQNPQAATARPASSPPGPVGGAVALDSQYWVARPTETEFRNAISRCDSIVLVKGARQMGKTSLLARGLQQAREAGAICLLTDFQKLNEEHLRSDEAFFKEIGNMIADQLDLDVLPEDIWNSKRGANSNFERYMRREALAKRDAPVVWAMDEVDRLFSCAFGSGVFGLFRSWHNERSLDPSGPWSRLTLAIAYATEAHLFITDMNQSPFNVGTRLTLEDFTPEQVAALNRKYGLPLKNAAAVERFMALVSGQPYLTQRGLTEMAAQRLDIGALEAQADREEGIYGDHLRRFLFLLAKDREMCDVMRGVLRGQPCPTPESFYRLRSAGLLVGDAAQDARPRCRIYATYLSRHLKAS